MTASKILIVDDEIAIRDMIRMSLEMEGFLCLEAEDIRQAHAIIVDQRPDLVLLDWMLPGGSGIELLRRLNRDSQTENIPIIMLTAKTAEDNIVQGLEAGADDYLTKPFPPRQLVARIRALLRRSTTGNPQTINVGKLELDSESKRVFIDGQLVELGPTEFRLLEFFISHPERAYSRGQLLDNVWGANVYVEERTVDVHVRRLRKALEVEGGAYSKLIQTVRGTGYRFSERGVAL